MQIDLFEAALDTLDENSDLVNRVLEVTLKEASDAEILILRYELPAMT